MNAASNPREVIGGNHPPSVIDLAFDATKAAWLWLEPRPVIDGDEDAREGKAHVDRLAAALKSMEAERDGKVRPLNDQVRAINGSYKPPRERVEAAMAVVKARLTDYAARLEAQRWREAEAARLAAQAAADAAREAEARERAAKEEAAQGVCDAPLAETTEQADAAFAAFHRADHAAQRAQRDTKVRVVGGFSGRALTLRDTEVLSVADWKAAIEEMGGPGPDVLEAILKQARAYRKLTGELPIGIAQTYDRHL